MSQHWHGHWTNEAFKPVRLKNWEVPNWHPCWPDRHCKVTQFMADNQGRILVGQKRSTQSPWGYFKGTWELPTKISRQKAYELSAPPQYKIKAWEQHKKANKKICRTGNTETIMKRKKDNTPTNLLPKDVEKIQVSQESEPDLPPHPPCIADTTPKNSCPIHDTCQI